VTNIKVGDRIFFAHSNGYGRKKQQASGLVVDIRQPMGEEGPDIFEVSCDTPGVWLGTYNPETKTRIVDVPDWEVWRLK